MKRYVLDASPLITLFEDRPGADKVEELLSEAAEANRPLLMSVINWCEAYYSEWRMHGEEVADEKLRQMAELPVEVVDVQGKRSGIEMDAVIDEAFGDVAPADAPRGLGRQTAVNTPLPPRWAGSERRDSAMWW